MSIKQLFCLKNKITNNIPVKINDQVCGGCRSYANKYKYELIEQSPGSSLSPPQLYPTLQSMASLDGPLGSSSQASSSHASSSHASSTQPIYANISGSGPPLLPKSSIHARHYQLDQFAAQQSMHRHKPTHLYHTNILKLLVRSMQLHLKYLE